MMSIVVVPKAADGRNDGRQGRIPSPRSTPAMAAFGSGTTKMTPHARTGYDLGQYPNFI